MTTKQTKQLIVRVKAILKEVVGVAAEIEPDYTTMNWNVQFENGFMASISGLTLHQWRSELKAGNKTLMAAMVKETALNWKKSIETWESIPYTSGTNSSKTITTSTQDLGMGAWSSVQASTGSQYVYMKSQFYDNFTTEPKSKKAGWKPQTLEEMYAGPPKL